MAQANVELGAAGGSENNGSVGSGAKKGYSTPEEKKEEYRLYLDRTGVVDAITKVLVGLYEEGERPPKPIEYIKRYFGAPTNVNIVEVQEENQELKDENLELKKIITELSKKNQDLRDRLEEYES